MLRFLDDVHVPGWTNLCPREFLDTLATAEFFDVLATVLKQPAAKVYVVPQVTGKTPSAEEEHAAVLVDEATTLGEVVNSTGAASSANVVFLLIKLAADSMPRQPRFFRGVLFRPMIST